MNRLSFLTCRYMFIVVRSPNDFKLALLVAVVNYEFSFKVCEIVTSKNVYDTHKKSLFSLIPYRKVFRSKVLRTCIHTKCITSTIIYVM